MLKRRTVLLGVSVLCVAVLIMPYTVSLFGKQHEWKAAADVNCISCHTDIDYPSANYMHVSLNGSEPGDYCDSCHQIGTSGSSVGVTGAGGYDEEHAAVTVECLDCHEDAIGGMNDTWYTAGDEAQANADKGFINVTSEAHSNMTGSATDVQGAWAFDYLSGNNEACIACHTNITLEIYMTPGATVMNITAWENVWGNWTVNYTAKP